MLTDRQASGEDLCGFGEFDSLQTLYRFIELLCSLPGGYEVHVQAESGEEGILHCSNDTVRHAAWRDLSGLDALAVILSWPRVKFCIQPLPLLPMRTINLPLNLVFEEVERKSMTYRWLLAHTKR